MPPAKDTPVLDPIAFFSGDTSGRGTVRVALKTAVPLRVESRGVADGKGALAVDQRIREGDKAARSRRWIIRPAGPGRYTGTLTDAEGPVSVAASGNSAQISYTMHNGLDVDQRLVLADDRSTIRNHMTISKWGMRLAWVDERIGKPR